MSNVLAILSLLVSSYFLLRIFRPAGRAEGALAFFLLFAAQIIGLGYTLSLAGVLDEIKRWALGGGIAFLLSAAAALWRKGLSFRADTKRIAFKIADLKIEELSRFEKAIFFPLLLTALLTGVLNLAAVLFAAPHNWDSLTYHLARVAYYLQQGSLKPFDANYWAQVIHPKNSTLLLIYTYLVSGRNENLMQAVQYVCYWISVCAVYAIARKTGGSAKQSLFAALVASLLVEWLMQASTTQNDLTATAFLGASVYFLLAFRETRAAKYLFLSAVGTALLLGTKTSALLFLLPAAAIAVYSLIQFRLPLRPQLRHIFLFAVFTLFAVFVFVLPAGYVDNYFRYGHPLGPQDVRTHHSFEGESLEYIFRNGAKNLARYGLDFLSLDGLPPVDLVLNAQSALRALPEKAAYRLGLTSKKQAEAARVRFIVERQPVSHEDLSYWGILGFGLVWEAVFLAAAGWLKPPALRVLAWAAVLFFFSQAYAGPYDPWRGRYFTAAAIFAVPTVGALLPSRNKFIRAWLLFVIPLGCISAVTAVVFRANSALVSAQYQGLQTESIFAMNRMRQLTRNTPDYYEPLQRYDELTPADATVAVFLYVDAFEYPLFGEGLTRTIFPINSFDKGVLPIPAEADYLLYGDGFPCPALPEDTHLGEDLYLRKLTADNRQCP